MTLKDLKKKSEPYLNVDRNEPEERLQQREVPEVVGYCAQGERMTYLQQVLATHLFIRGGKV